MNRMVVGVIGIAVVLVAFLAISYHKPVMTSAEAVKQAVVCLNHNQSNKAKHFSVNNSLVWKGVTHTTLTSQNGPLNQWTNSREWKISFKFGAQEPTVFLNAYSGKCLSIGGPLS